MVDLENTKRCTVTKKSGTLGAQIFDVTVNGETKGVQRDELHIRRIESNQNRESSRLLKNMEHSVCVEIVAIVFEFK